MLAGPPASPQGPRRLPGPPRRRSAAGRLPRPPERGGLRAAVVLPGNSFGRRRRQPATGARRNPATIQDSLHAILKDKDLVCARFYDVFFERCPPARDCFRVAEAEVVFMPEHGPRARRVHLQRRRAGQRLGGLFRDGRQRRQADDELVGVVKRLAAAGQGVDPEQPAFFDLQEMLAAAEPGQAGHGGAVEVGRRLGADLPSVAGKR